MEEESPPQEKKEVLKKETLEDNKKLQEKSEDIMTKEEEITKYLSLIEYNKEQINSIEIQSSYLQAAIADYYKAKMTIENLKKEDKDTEILIPIGGGTYINAFAKNTTRPLF